MAMASVHVIGRRLSVAMIGLDVLLGMEKVLDFVFQHVQSVLYWDCNYLT